MPSIANMIDWVALQPAIPEIFLGTAICLLLLVDAFTAREGRTYMPTLSLVTLLAGAVLTLKTASLESTVVMFGGSYVADPLATFLKLLAFLATAVALFYSRHYLQRRGILKGEYYILALTALLGIFVIVSANSLLTLYVGVELQALSIYAMVAFDRDSGVAAESAIKYFVLGAIASGAMLYGMSLIYGLTGTLQLDELGARLVEQAPGPGVLLGMLFLVVAIAFKFGAAPFHMWVPDVYHGAPTGVVGFIASAPKLASFALAFRLLGHGLETIGDDWSRALTVIAVLSLVIGNVVAVAQTNLKRLLAYSAIGNVGFILLGFVAGNEAGYEAALYYTIAYVLMVLGSFGVILLAGRDGVEADEISSYAGLGKRDPLLALCMMFLMFSTAGIPPFVGFWAKLTIFQVLWQTQHTALVMIAAAVSVIGVFYYLRIVKVMYFDAPGELPGGERLPAVRAVLTLNAVAVLALGLLPHALLAWCSQLLASG
ncbi:MAG: NADH-quinone oxidoreductase subunit NuoN [Steroidobacteraceae bacterium]